MQHIVVLDCWIGMRNQKVTKQWQRVPRVLLDSLIVIEFKGQQGNEKVSEKYQESMLCG